MRRITGHGGQGAISPQYAAESGNPPLQEVPHAQGPRHLAEAGGRATAHGTWTDTDTGGWLTACRSSRRSFPPRSEGRSWRGATGWPGPRGWRRKEYLCGKLRRPCPGVATSRLANPRPGDVEAPLRLTLKLADRAEAGRAEIDGSLGIPGPSDSIRGFIGHVRHRADLTGRRILKGGTVPHRGKVHPISRPHTRWISKGKAGVPVEPGVPVRVPEDRHRFIPHHSVMWEGSDVDVAVPMGGEARARFPDLSVVSFGRGPHSPPGPAGACRDAGADAMPRGGGCRRRTASGKAGRRSAGRGAPTPRAGRPSATWSTAASTGCGATGRRVSPAPWRWRCRPRTSTGEPAHGRPRRRVPGPACPLAGGGLDVHHMLPPPTVPSKPRASPPGTLPRSPEAGIRRIRPDPLKNTGFSGRHYLISREITISLNRAQKNICSVVAMTKPYVIGDIDGIRMIPPILETDAVKAVRTDKLAELAVIR